MSIELFIFLSFLLGLVSGFLGGLLGIGGGVVTVPVLYFLFLLDPLLNEQSMQLAVSTSLAAAVITSLLSAYLQWRKKAVLWPPLCFLIPGLIVGCVGGSFLAHLLSSEILSHIFGSFALLLGVYFVFPQLPPLFISATPNATLSLFGLTIGGLSSLLGIGGGALAFPVLIGYQIPVKNASATSSAATFVTTLVGSIAYLSIAWQQPELPSTFGYIQLPAFLSISSAAICAAPLGVKLVHKLDVAWIKRVFGLCLFLIGLTLLFL